MARSILIPNHHSYIMCPSGNQAQETFGKIEDLAKNKIASVQGATAVFLGELVKLNAGDDGFVHDKNSHHCELYNGSTINTLNSVAKNIVGIRSHLNFYIITCSNRISSSVLESNPELTTTKEDKENHGKGMSILRDVAKNIIYNIYNI